MQLLPPLQQFVFRNDVVVYELLDLNVAVVVQITLTKDFVHYLSTVVFVDPLLRQEHHHLVSIDVAVAIEVDSAEFVVQFSLFFGLVLLAYHFL